MGGKGSHDRDLVPKRERRAGGGGPLSELEPGEAESSRACRRQAPSTTGPDPCARRGLVVEGSHRPPGR